MIDSIKGTLTYAGQEAEKGLGVALGMTPRGLIDYVKDSGLKGRGGAGFITGLKWQFAADAPCPRMPPSRTRYGQVRCVSCR